MINYIVKSFFCIRSYPAILTRVFHYGVYLRYGVYLFPLMSFKCYNAFLPFIHLQSKHKVKVTKELRQHNLLNGQYMSFKLNSSLVNMKEKTLRQINCFLIYNQGQCLITCWNRKSINHYCLWHKKWCKQLTKAIFWEVEMNC